MRDLIWLASQAISHMGYFYGVVCTVKKQICSFYKNHFGSCGCQNNFVKNTEKL